MSRSQQSRNWNPDRSFNWRSLRHDHSQQLMTIIEGFYAVEQYAPDYTAELTRLARKGYGHSQFQIRWGAEEEKHSDLWRNVLLYGLARTPTQLEQYTQDLREKAWQAPFDTLIEMLIYTVFQERATQLIYLKTGDLARGKRLCPHFSDSRDTVLAEAISTIAIDEAAHYDFFLAIARLYLYYFPEETLEALVKVLRNFVMPASRIVPNYEGFITVLYEAQLFGPRVYGREVAKPALKALGIDAIKTVEEGITRSRMTPTPEGMARAEQPFSGCNFAVLETAVQGLFDRVNRYEREVGLADLRPTVFVPFEW